MFKIDYKSTTETIKIDYMTPKEVIKQIIEWDYQPGPTKMFISMLTDDAGFYMMPPIKTENMKSYRLQEPIYGFPEGTLLHWDMVNRLYQIGNNGIFFTKEFVRDQDAMFKEVAEIGVNCWAQTEPGAFTVNVFDFPGNHKELWQIIHKALNDAED